MGSLIKRVVKRFLYGSAIIGAFFMTYVLRLNSEGGAHFSTSSEPTGLTGLSVGGAPFAYADAPPSDSGVSDSGDVAASDSDVGDSGTGSGGGDSGGGAGGGDSSGCGSDSGG